MFIKNWKKEIYTIPNLLSLFRLVLIPVYASLYLSATEQYQYVLAGVILGVGRIVGETAALMYTSGTVEKVAGLMDSGITLSVHMYRQASEGLYTEQAYATAVVLLALVLM